MSRCIILLERSSLDMIRFYVKINFMTRFEWDSQYNMYILKYNIIIGATYV